MVAFQRKSRLSQPEDDVLAEAVRLPGAGRSGQPPRALVQDGGRSFRSHLEGCGHSRAGLRQPCPKAGPLCRRLGSGRARSEEHTSELQSLMRTSYAVFCLKKKKTILYSETTQ